MARTLRKKAVIMIILIAVLLSGVALLVNYMIIHNMIQTHYKEHTEELASTVAIMLDTGAMRTVRDETLAIYNRIPHKVGSEKWGTPEFDAYLANYSEVSEMPEFQKLMDSLRAVQSRNDVDCIYIATVVPEDEVFLYLVDAALEDPCLPGVLDPIYDFNAEVITDPARGFPPYTTRTEEYGWLVTGGVPVYDAGEVVGYCLVDISMNSVMERIRLYGLYTAVLLLVITLIVIWIFVFIIERGVVSPIRRLSDAAREYSREDAFGDKRVFDGIEIHTGDEIQELYESISQMESDLHEYYDNLLATKQELVTTREYADNMDRLASLDGLTGVRNKRAYEMDIARIEDDIKEGRAVFAIAMIDMNNLKQTNDLYGHERGDEAILQLCNLVCGVFMHSPVYRFGGDEFVVLLEKIDYDRRLDLIFAFDRMIAELSSDESLEPWERLSAALGCAEFVPGQDKSLDDVFARADERMYRRKKEMKTKLG